MKRTEITRKTPMKRGAPMTRGTLRTTSKPAKKRLRTKQLAVTAEDKNLWDRLAALGCIACMKDGIFQPLVSIHHVDGRTKPGCHRLVLPLCAGHHQDGTGPDPTMVAVHPWKARFEKRYGDQETLIAECMELLGEPWKSNG